ncbi:biotin--[acetyl-CoA-carboxylase] ligase, partial [Dermatophilus congolensis]
LNTQHITNGTLAPTGPWSRVDIHETTGSTNDDALADPTPYRLIIAAHQNAGRGRRSRTWITPPGTSIAMSMTLPLPTPTSTSPAHHDPGWLPLLIGLATHDALAELITTHTPHTNPKPPHPTIQAKLKWPNDILIRTATNTENNAKVGGILCQLAPNTNTVIAGIGINVAVPKNLLPTPTDTAPPATSLHHALTTIGGTTPTREEIAINIANHVAHRHHQWITNPHTNPLHNDYTAACATINTPITAHLPNNTTLTGTATAITPHGELLIATPHGPTTLRAGDVVHIRPTNRQN